MPPSFSIELIILSLNISLYNKVEICTFKVEYSIVFPLKKAYKYIGQEINSSSERKIENVHVFHRRAQPLVAGRTQEGFMEEVALELARTDCVRFGKGRAWRQEEQGYGGRKV